MSIKSVNQFLTKVNENEKLQAELSQTMKAKNDLQATVELAAKHGYEFSAKELDERIEQLQSIRDKQAANQELNESELEAVAGGGVTVTTAVALNPNPGGFAEELGKLLDS